VIEAFGGAEANVQLIVRLDADVAAAKHRWRQPLESGTLQSGRNTVEDEGTISAG
jgi:hypothetical protein